MGDAAAGRGRQQAGAEDRIMSGITVPVPQGNKTGTPVPTPAPTPSTPAAPDAEPAAPLPTGVQPIDLGKVGGK